MLSETGHDTRRDAERHRALAPHEPYGRIARDYAFPNLYAATFISPPFTRHQDGVNDAKNTGDAACFMLVEGPL